MKRRLYLLATVVLIAVLAKCHYERESAPEALIEMEPTGAGRKIDGVELPSYFRKAP